MNTAVSTEIKSRFPMPAGLSELDAGKWRVLCESVFPTAKTPEAIALALDYCKARKLDVFKKPVNIVSMWSANLGREVETVWPGINSVQIDAARTNAWAGMDEPKWGPDIKRTFKGVRKNNVGESELVVTFPEWCSVTVYRIVQGQRYAFCEPVYWIEAYARIGKTELPNDMWAKRPRGQFLKVAKAFSLRAAFPEDADYTAEEMEGRVIEEVNSNGMIVEHQPLKVSSPFKNAALRNAFTKGITEALSTATTMDALNETISANKEKLDAMRASSSDHDQITVDSINNHYKICREQLKNVQPSDTVAASFGPEFAETLAGDIGYNEGEIPPFEEDPTTKPISSIPFRRVNKEPPL